MAGGMVDGGGLWWQTRSRGGGGFLVVARVCAHVYDPIGTSPPGAPFSSLLPPTVDAVGPTGLYERVCGGAGGVIYSRMESATCFRPRGGKEVNWKRRTQKTYAGAVTARELGRSALASIRTASLRAGYSLRLAARDDRTAGPVGADVRSCGSRAQFGAVHPRVGDVAHLLLAGAVHALVGRGGGTDHGGGGLRKESREDG